MSFWECLGVGKSEAMVLSPSSRPVLDSGCSAPGVEAKIKRARNFAFADGQNTSLGRSIWQPTETSEICVLDIYIM